MDVNGEWNEDDDPGRWQQEPPPQMDWWPILVATLFGALFWGCVIVIAR